MKRKVLLIPLIIFLAIAAALLWQLAPEAVAARYKLSDDCGGDPQALLEAACRGRGWLLSGGRYDTARAAALVLDEFRGGKIGKITSERAERSVE